MGTKSKKRQASYSTSSSKQKNETQVNVHFNTTNSSKTTKLDSPLLLYFFQAELFAREETRKSEDQNFTNLNREFSYAFEKELFLEEENRRIKLRVQNCTSAGIKLETVPLCTLERENFLKEEEIRKDRRIKEQLSLVSYKETKEREAFEREEEISRLAGLWEIYELNIGKWLRIFFAKHADFSSLELNRRHFSYTFQEERRAVIEAEFRRNMEVVLVSEKETKERKTILNLRDSEIEIRNVELQNTMIRLLAFESEKHSLQKSEFEERQEENMKEQEARDFIAEALLLGWQNLSDLVEQRLKEMPSREDLYRQQLMDIQELTFIDLCVRQDILFNEITARGVLNVLFEININVNVMEVKERCQLNFTQQLELVVLSEVSQRLYLLSLNTDKYKHMFIEFEKQLRFALEQSFVAEMTFNLIDLESFSRKGDILFQAFERNKIQIAFQESEKRVSEVLIEENHRKSLIYIAMLHKVLQLETENRRIHEVSAIYGAQMCCVEFCETARRRRMMFYFDEAQGLLEIEHWTIGLYLVRNLLQKEEKQHRCQQVEVEKNSRESLELMANQQHKKLFDIEQERSKKKAAVSIQCMFRQYTARIATKKLRDIRAFNMSQEINRYAAVRISCALRKNKALVIRFYEKQRHPTMVAERDARKYIKDLELQEANLLQKFALSLHFMNVHTQSLKQVELQETIGFAYLLEEFHVLFSFQLGEQRKEMWLNLVEHEERISLKDLELQYKYNTSEILKEFYKSAFEVALKDEFNKRVIISQQENKAYAHWMGALNTGISNFQKLNKIQDSMRARLNLADREYDRRQRVETEAFETLRVVKELCRTIQEQLVAVQNLLWRENRNRYLITEEDVYERNKIQAALRFNVTQLRVNVFERGIGPVIGIRDMLAPQGILWQAKAHRDVLNALPQVVMWAVDKKEATARFEVVRYEMESREAIRSAFRQGIQSKDIMSPYSRVHSISPILARPLMQTIPISAWQTNFTRATKMPRLYARSVSAEVASPMKKELSLQTMVAAHCTEAAAPKLPVSGAGLAAWLSNSHNTTCPF